MPTRYKPVLIAAGVVALLLAVIFIGPSLINVDRYRPRLISYLQEKTGKQVEIGRIGFTFFPLSLHVDKFGVKNPPIFPPGYIVQVERIDAELGVGGLLHRKLVVKSLLLEGLVLNLTSDPDGPWNFENPQSEVFLTPLFLGPISNVRITHGQVIASNLLPSDAAGPVFFEARDISADLEQVN